MTPAFSADGPSKDIDYVPLGKASKPWNVCVSFPHMKDAYWLGVDYGVTEDGEAPVREAERGRGRRGRLIPSYPARSRIASPRASRPVVIGAISYDGLNNLVKELAEKKIPVIEVINGISSPELAAKSLVSF